LDEISFLIVCPWHSFKLEWSFFQNSEFESEDVTPTNLSIEPPLDWDTVENLFNKFDGIVRGFCDVDLLTEARSTVDKTDEVKNFFSSSLFIPGKPSFSSLAHF
jgi:hypothetical protein